MERGSCFEDLAKACGIFAKYNKESYATCCQHDVFYVAVDSALVTEEELAELDRLGFHPDENGGFSSFRFGSC